MLLSKELFTEIVTQIYPKRILNENETNMELKLISIYHKEHFKHSSTRETSICRRKMAKWQLSICKFFPIQPSFKQIILKQCRNRYAEHPYAKYTSNKFKIFHEMLHEMVKNSN